MQKLFHIFSALILILGTIFVVPSMGMNAKAASIDGLKDVSAQFYDGITAVTEITPSTTEVRLKYAFDWGTIGSDGKTVSFQLPMDVFSNVQPVPANTPIATLSSMPIGTYSITTDGLVTLKLNPNLQNAKGEVLAIAKINPDYTIEKSIETVELADGKTVDLPFHLNNSDAKFGTVDDDKTKITWTVDVNKNLQAISNAKLTDAITDPDLTIVPKSLKIYKLAVGMDGSVTQGADVTSKFTKNTNNNTVSVNFGNITGAYRVVFDTTVDANVYNKTFDNVATFNGNDVTSSTPFFKPIAISKEAKTKKKATTNTNAGAVSSSNAIEWEITLNSGGHLTIPKNAILEDTVSFSTGQNPRNVEAALSTIKIFDGTKQLKVNTDYKIIPIPTASGETDKFAIKFLKDFNKELKITYTTHDSAISDYYGDKANKIDNQAKLFNNDGPDQQEMSVKNEGKASYTYTQGKTKQFSKKIVDIDYQKQEATYRLFVRVPVAGVERLSVEEFVSKEFGDSLHQVKPTITRYPASEAFVTVTIPHTSKTYYKVRDSAVGTRLTENVDYTIENHAANNKEQYHLYTGNGYTKAGLYQIDLVLPFNTDLNPSGSTIRNDAKVLNNGIEVTSGYTEQIYSYKNNEYMMNNGFKNGHYDEKNREIQWEVGFNYNIRSLTDAVITDTFEGNQQLKKNSFKLYRWNIDVPFEGSKAVSHYDGTREEISIAAATWTKAVSSNADGNGFTLDMNQLFTDPAFKKIPDKDKQAYVVTYRTTFEDDLIDKNKYKNKYEIAYENDIPALATSEINGQVTVPRGGDHASKTGEQISQGSRIVHWSIDVNAAQSNVKDIHIADQLSDGQILLPGTVKVYEAKLEIGNDGKGTLVKQGNPLALDADYTVNAEGNTLAIDIPGEIDEKKTNKSYIVEYYSFVTAADGSSVSNQLSIKGSNNAVFESQNGASDAFALAFATASGSATAPIPTGDIQIKKTAAHTNNAMSGVKFGATFEYKGVPYTVYATTNSNGVATFDNLPAGAILIVENTTKPGYVLDTTEYEVTVVADELAPLEINNQPETSVTLTKVDEELNTKKLAGAQFKLQRKDGNTYKDVDAKGKFVASGERAAVFTTSEDAKTLGQFNIKNLPVGDYQFIETKAPTGYDIHPDPYTFTLRAGALNVAVQASNKATILGTVLLTKVDSKDSALKLPNAVFKIQKFDGSTYVDIPNRTSLKTDSNGQLAIDNLEIGKYRIIEVTAPTGYVASTQPYDIEITKAKINVPIIVNNTKETPKPGTVKIVKVDREDPSIKLPNAYFDLLLSDGQVVKVGPTNSEGEVIVTNVPVGTHQLKETTPPAGYLLDSNSIAVTVKTAETSTYTVTNTKEPVPTGTLEVKKIDSANQKELQGAEFTLSNGTIAYKVGPTGTNGVATLANVPTGTYNIVETKAPVGYALNIQPKTVTITTDTTSTVTIENTILPVPIQLIGQMKIVKVDASNQQLRLPNASFTITDGVTTKQVVTDAHGEAIVNDLPIGTYVITETKAPTGYVLQSTSQTVKVEADQTVTVMIDNVKENPLGTLELTKVDVDDEEEPLANAQFTLSNGKMEMRLTTDTDGFATATVAPGMYVLTETKAPTGYILDNTPMMIEITENETTSKIVYNTKKFVETDIGVDDDVKDGVDGDNDDTNSGRTPNAQTSGGTRGDNGGTTSNSGGYTSYNGGATNNGGYTGQYNGSTAWRPTDTLNATNNSVRNNGISDAGYGYTLPQTNGQSLSGYMLLGVIFVIIAAVLLLRRRKTTK